MYLKNSKVCAILVEIIPFYTHMRQDFAQAVGVRDVQKEEAMELKITCIPGDGIGPEIVAEAKKCLRKWPRNMVM